jgi:CRP/FNR family transcriptional regulator, cyclic AMP receptor protein
LPRRYRAFLQQNGWLSQADPEFADALLGKAGRIFASKDDTVWQAGDDEGGLFALVEGDVSFYTSAGTSGAPLLHIFGPGFWTGEGTIITGDPKRISLVARGPLTALTVSRTEVLRLLAARPEWWREIGRLAVQLQQLAAGGAADLVLPTSELRCAAVLLRISGLRYHDAAGRSIVQLSHEELAQMSGISRQTAARSIAALEEKGLIRLRYGTIEMLAPAQLRQMVEDA